MLQLVVALDVLTILNEPNLAESMLRFVYPALLKLKISVIFFYFVINKNYMLSQCLVE